jgi:serine/threonine protein kinase/tetratricopeptide (TPR) repeat protein
MKTGQTIAHYEILEKLGEGGMGVVYKAQDSKLNRLVALKFLSSGKMGSEKEKARFLREAQTAAALAHPNICTVYEINEAEEPDSDGKQTYIAMAHIEGDTLQEKISEKRPTIKEALKYAIQIAGGISDAHDKGIIHRDIKSANIMINEKDQAIIMDFGLAKQRGQSMLTVEGTTLGTISYMSPEQTRGETVDQRTDIWAFGVMLYEMITGQMPFRGEYDQAVIYSIMNEEPQALSALVDDIPPGLQEIIDKALAKLPDKRYQHAAGIVQDLESIQNAIIGSESGITPVTENTVTGEKITFIKDILQRRVPQIIGIYLAVSWGIIQFIEWLVNRYPISPHLPEFSLAILASMIPTVLLLAYFHGKPGRDQWTMAEKVGIPVNVVVAAIFLFFNFGGKDLGAATKIVSVEDEAGNTISRAIPKTEFRQRLGLFYLDNQSNDSTLNWLQYGLTYLLVTDLSQDVYFTNKWNFSASFERAGFKDGMGVPLALKKQIAEEHHLSKFLDGTFRKENEEYIVETKLYDTNTGKLIADNTFSGEDIFILTDEITNRLKQDLQIPDYHLANTEDLPVSELTTKNLNALQHYAEGEFAYVNLRDFKTGISKFEEAVQIDPQFALAWLNLHGVYALANRTDESMEAVAKALQYKYRLTETYAYYARIELYALQGDMESALAVTENWVQLYPDNVEARELLASLYRFKNELDLAIAERKRILQIEPANYEQLQEIARYYELKGDITASIQYLEMYAEKFPDRYESFNKIGNIYKSIGEFIKSRDYYKKARLIEPDKHSVIDNLADIEVQLGNFDQALAQYEKALNTASGRGEKADIYISLSEYYQMRGQIDKAIENFDLRIAEHRTHWPAILVNQLKPLAMELYLAVGRKTEAMQLIRDFEREVTLPNVSGFVAALYINYYLDAGDTASVNLAGKKLTDLRAFIENTQAGHLVLLSDILEGKIAHAKGNYQHAITCFTRTLKEKGVVEDGAKHRYLAISYHASDEYDKALEHLEAALKLEPMKPANHYEIALVYHSMEETEKAMTHLNKALEIWDEADPDYKPAKKAKETLAQWQL